MKKTISFWKRHVEDGSLISFVKAHPAKAQKFFGAIPSMRCDLRELLGILTAHEVLAADPEDLTREVSQLVEVGMRDSLENASPEIRDRFLRNVRQMPCEIREQAQATLKNARGG